MDMKNEREQNKSATPSVHTSNNSTKKPQWQVVFEELERHPVDGITSWDMITRHHITRTAAHICTLRKMGFNIVSKNETKDGVTYSRYWFLGDDEEDEDEDDDYEVFHDYVDEPYVDEDRLKNIAEWEALGEWMSRR